LPLSFDKLRMVSLAEPFSKEGYKDTFVLLEPITEGLPHALSMTRISKKDYTDSPDFSMHFISV